MMEYLLEARGICKSYGDLVANDNINLAVSAGVIHALIGENGAGKSTLVNILYGTVSADAGSFFWRGREVKIDSRKRRGKWVLVLFFNILLCLNL